MSKYIGKPCKCGRVERYKKNKQCVYCFDLRNSGFVDHHTLSNVVLKIPNVSAWFWKAKTATRITVNN